MISVNIVLSCVLICVLLNPVVLRKLSKQLANLQKIGDP